RASDADVHSLLSAHGWQPTLVAGDDPATVFRQLYRVLDSAYAEIRRIQRTARQDGVTEYVRWPAIVLRTPKGWTGPDVVDGVQIEGTFRAHQVPLSGVKDDAAHRRLLEQWM